MFPTNKPKARHGHVLQLSPPARRPATVFHMISQLYVLLWFTKLKFLPQRPLCMLWLLLPVRGTCRPLPVPAICHSRLVFLP